MITALLALLASVLLDGAPPDALNDPSRVLTEVVPEGRVLFAETEQRDGRPTLKEDTLGPSLSAESYVVIDVGTGAVLAAQNPSAIRPVASLTKLLTALTVAQRVDPEEVVTVSPRAARAGRLGADMDLVPGERLTVRDLLAGLLVPSANDAAVALAEHVSGSEERFSKDMNQVAQSMGLSRTHAVNATGLDHPGHYSSAYDMGLLLARVWRDPLLGLYLRATSLDVTAVDNRKTHHLRTTNRLLGRRTDILAGKTGFTDAAGQSLAVVAENDAGHSIVAVLLGSADRFADMDNLLNWTFWAYQWPEPARGR